MSNSYAPTHRQEPSLAAPGDPVRHPSGAPAPVLTKRAFMLVLMTLLVPGSAQIVAGNRRLGRAALRVTVTVWALALLAVLLLVVSRSTLINILAGQIPSLLLVLGLALLALGWAGLFLNTLRLIRPGTARPPDPSRGGAGARAGHDPQQRFPGLRRLSAQRRPRRHRQHLPVPAPPSSPPTGGTTS